MSSLLKSRVAAGCLILLGLTVLLGLGSDARSGGQVWVAEGTNEDGDYMRFVLSSYSRSYWRFEKPIRFFPLTTVLYYNEYPGRIVDFELRSNTQHLTLKDLGRGVGNSEHTWGTLF